MIIASLTRVDGARGLREGSRSTGLKHLRRTKWPSLVEASSTAKARAPEKTSMADSGTQLLPHAGRWDDRGGAVLRSETTVDVCRDFAICRGTTSPSQSGPASRRVVRGGGKWPAP